MVNGYLSILRCFVLYCIYSGTLVLHQLEEQLSSKDFDGIRNDVIAVRAPSSDRLLNSIMRGCDIACQVSTREGYEVKVCVG